MLAQLSSLKTRLGIADADLSSDDTLNAFLSNLSARFDKETNRTLARTVDATFEFDPDDVEIIPPCYPIESVSKFELKQNETDGWSEITGVTYTIRRACVLSLDSSLNPQQPTLNTSRVAVARVTYTGGYVLPGDTADTGQTPLPSDIEQSVIEQAAAWYLRKDQVGLEIRWDKGGAYLRISQLPLLPQVQTVIAKHQRYLT
jgi:hypothetical protein